jgi:hypothetical protein
MEKKYRQDSEQANERNNRILYLHSQWLRENGYKNWKKCERASKEEKRGSVSVPIAKQGSS